MKKIIMIMLLFVGFQAHAGMINGDQAWRVDEPREAVPSAEMQPGDLGSLIVPGMTLTFGPGPVPDSTVPEPSIIALFGAGLVAIGFIRRRRSK